MNPLCFYQADVCPPGNTLRMLKHGQADPDRIDIFY
jgi:hypothetical protein